MTFLPKDHPWNGQYAIPEYVLKEPHRRGTFTTGYAPRGRVDMPKRVSMWKNPYALPDYVRSENVGGEVHRTKYLPRRTIGVSPSALGDDQVGPGKAGDPITEFGNRTADYIVNTLGQLPKDKRRTALNALLNQLEPGLAKRVQAAEVEARNEGLSPKAALRAAIASETATGFLKQIIETGERRNVKTKSIPGLITKPGADKVVLEGAMRSLGGIGDFFKDAGNWIVGAGKTIGKFGCQAMQNPLGQASAAAAGGAYGGQTGAAAGMAGAQIIGAACAKPGAPMGPVYQPPPPSPVGPILLGVGTLAVVLLLAK